MKSFEFSPRPPESGGQRGQIANAKFLRTHTGTAYTEFRHAEVSACEFPSSAEEGCPRHQKENGAATFDGADGVVLVKRMHDFLTNTTPSARLWSLRGILASRSRAHPSVLLIWTMAIPFKATRSRGVPVTRRRNR